LLSARNAAPHDFPGVVMQSLTVALALCNSEGSLEPLAAYRAIAALGGDQGASSSALTDWIQHGTVAKGAPQPKPDRAGTAAGDLAQRQQALREHLLLEAAKFHDEVVDQDHSVSVYDYPVSWELREHILEALQELTSAVMATRSADTGV